MHNKKITLAKIAEYAGVSSATVSRVLNHRDQVKSDTIDLVENAIDALGYAFATSPAVRDDKGVLVFNVPDTGNPFYSELVRGAVTAANAHGYYILISHDRLHSDTIDYFCSMLKRVNASGLILTSMLPLGLLNQINSIVPFVQCCEYNKESQYPFVTVDDLSAAKNATEYLISAGRNKIGFINGPLSFKFAQERRDGFTHAMQNAEISVPNNWIVSFPEINYDMAFSAICQILSSEIIPNAFFTASDVYAAAVIRAARRYALSVPNDIMVIGFDNIDTSIMMCPSITTVNMPKFQLGFSAIGMLLENIENPTISSKSLFLDTELIIRESTASNS